MYIWYIHLTQYMPVAKLGRPKEFSIKKVILSVLGHIYFSKLINRGFNVNEWNGDDYLPGIPTTLSILVVARASLWSSSSSEHPFGTELLADLRNVMLYMHWKLKWQPPAPDWSQQCPLDELPAPVPALTQPSPVEQGLLVSPHLTLARTPHLLPSFSALPLLALERRVCSSSRFLEHYSNAWGWCMWTLSSKLKTTTCLATPETQISSPSFPKIESPRACSFWSLISS